MPQTPHLERHFTASDTIRDIVIGMSDGLTEADRMWRQHSWVWRRDGYLIETTEVLFCSAGQFHSLNCNSFVSLLQPLHKK